MRFAFVEKHRNTIPTKRLCRIVDVTPRGYRAWCKRPASQRQRKDLVFLAHIREQHRLSLQSYGRPRMTEELKELGLDVGHRRVGRPLSADLLCKSPAGQRMRQNGISVIRTQKYKVTTDSNHSFNIAPNLLKRNFSADRPNRKWVVDISYVWTREG